jgi:Zn-dependent metalloprotease
MISGAAFAAPAAGGDTSDSEKSAVSANPDELAINYVRQHADSLGVNPEDVSDVFVLSSYTSEHTGVTHVNLNQRYKGLDVFGGHATVNVNPDDSILHVGSSFVGDLREATTAADAELDAVDAVEAAAGELDMKEPQNVRVLRAARTAGGKTTVSGGGISNTPIPVQQGWLPTEDGLRLAWQLTIDDVSGDHLWNAVIDADTGELIAVDDWVVQTSYQNHMSTLARNATVESTASANLAAGRTAWESANPVEDGSSYRAYPQESPNDGDRVLFENPADGTASPFG